MKPVFLPKIGKWALIPRGPLMLDYFQANVGMFGIQVMDHSHIPDIPAIIGETKFGVLQDYALLCFKADLEDAERIFLGVPPLNIFSHSSLDLSTIDPS